MSYEALPQRIQPDTSEIDPLLDLIVTGWGPHAIWLFGSRAKGTSGPESDWDLLVTLPEGCDEVDDFASYDLRRQSGVNADIVFCDRADFDSCVSVPNTLAYEVAHTGVVIYGN